MDVAEAQNLWWRLSQGRRTRGGVGECDVDEQPITAEFAEERDAEDRRNAKASIDEGCCTIVW